MKLALTRADLHRALTLVGRAVERRNTIPILSNVRLRSAPGRLTLTATDLDLMIETTIPAAVETAGETTLSAQVLAGYVGKLTDADKVTIDATTSGSAAVKSGRSRATLQTLDAGDFPDFIPGGGVTHRFDIAGATLAALLGQIEFAISSEETRYYLNGIFLHAIETEAGARLRAAATDGHRLGRTELLLPEGAAGMPGIIIPRKAVAEIGKIAAGAGEPRPDVSIEVSATTISIASGGDEDGTHATRLVSKLIDGTFPDYQRVIPAGNGNVATIAAFDLARSIDRVATIASERGRAIKLGFGADTLTLMMNNPDQGHAVEEIACGYDSVPIEIGFNARYAGDILKALDAKEVSIAMGDPGSPSVWTSPSDPSRLYVLMPMRV